MLLQRHGALRIMASNTICTLQPWTSPIMMLMMFAIFQHSLCQVLCQQRRKVGYFLVRREVIDVHHQQGPTIVGHEHIKAKQVQSKGGLECLYHGLDFFHCYSHSRACFHDWILATRTLLGLVQPKVGKSGIRSLRIELDNTLES